VKEIRYYVLQLFVAKKVRVGVDIGIGVDVGIGVYVGISADVGIVFLGTAICL